MWRPSGNGRTGRRLTLAPATRRALRPATTASESGEEEADEDDERLCAEGREALSRAVALAAEFSQRPKPIHGVELVGAIPSKFWAKPGEQEDSVVEDDDLSEPSTPQFISQALDAGFTIDELSRAEKALDSGTVPRDTLATPMGELAAV